LALVDKNGFLKTDVCSGLCHTKTFENMYTACTVLSLAIWENNEEIFLLSIGILLTFAALLSSSKVNTSASMTVVMVDSVKSRTNYRSINYSHIFNFPFLFSLTSTKRKKGKNTSWKLSKHEMKDGSITHLKSYNELQETVTRRRNKYAQLGCT
jgi:hypothetical protein